MTDRNRIKNHFRQQARWRRQLRERRGVLLLVVLSMLVLFMLVGTTFLMTSSQYRTSANSAARINQFENKPSDLLERALKQVLRDTQNPYSVARYHSLLRDMYGSDGFVGTIFVPRRDAQAVDIQATCSKFAGALATDPDPLGPTRGQIIEFTALPQGTKLEPDATGATAMTLSQTTGYYNGRLLTMLSGPAAGQSVRILDYVYDATRNLAQFRVMSITRADGSPLTHTGRPPEIAELVAGENIATPNDPNDMVGHSFMINGRPFNGTGVGYNSLAAVGAPRLSAYELLGNISDDIFGETALMPNSVYFFSDLVYGAQNSDAVYKLAYGNFPGAGDTDESYDAADFQNMYLALLSVMPRARGRIIDLNNIAAGPLEPDDPQVEQILSRFDQYRAVIDDVPLPSFHRPDLVNYWYLRLFDPARTPWLQSLSEQQRTRAILQPYRLDTNGDLVPDNGLNDEQAAMIAAIKRKFILRPLQEDQPNFDGSNPLSRSVFPRGPSSTTTGNVPWHIIGPWDVDNDNDGIPDSIWIDLGDPIQETADGRLYKALYAILVIDQDGKLQLNAHGSNEHIVNVPLDPTIDSTNNSGPGNLAHDPANADHAHTSNLLPQGSGWGPADISLRPVLSPNLPPALIGDRRADDYARLITGRPIERLDGNGSPVPDSPVPWGRYGGGEISGVANARPGVPVDIVPSNDPVAARNRLLATRDPHASYDFFNYPIFDTLWAQRTIASLPPADVNRIYLEQALAAHLPTSYGASPDLRCRYAIGLDYTGQRVYELVYEPTYSPIVDDSPYELNLTETMRNGAVTDSLAMTASYNTAAPINDDAPFAPAELERLLRAFDPDAAALPDRLWNLVDAFDPAKLAMTQAYINNFSDTSARLAQAQLDASINRRIATTETWDAPVPAGSFLARCQLGADGLPGTVDNRVLNDGQTAWPDAASSFDPDDLANSCDDYFVIMGETPPSGATIVDYLRYRIVLELKKKKVLAIDALASDPAVQQVINPIINHLMAPELLAGLKMDLNRPFGDGQDNNGNGVVDEFLEAGEPFFDGSDPPQVLTDGNGRWDAGEPYIDLDGNNAYSPPLDRALVTANPTTFAPFDYGHPADGVPKYIDGNTARQRYARYLYILALLTMDENYVAPYDEDSLQLRTWMKKLKDDLITAQPGLTPQDADLIVKKKLTYREVAQWAINCADMRDADVIMTPFEYDENPWDGWNVTEYDEDGNVVQSIPIDGDPATDENAGVGWTANGIETAATPPTLPFHTRGLVWGTERPELLITETLGLHDRRTEDLQSNSLEGHGTLENDDERKWNDDDLDQRHRPRGAAFVEVYNPHSSDGQRPAELYSTHPRDADGNITGPAVPSPGVELGRVSDNFVVQNGIQKRSPVWRMIVVEEHPEYRNDDQLDDERFDADLVGGVTNPPANTPFRYSDPDFPGFDYSFKPRWVRAAPQPPNVRQYDDRIEEGPNWSRNIFGIKYPYVEREFYFTTNHSPTIDDISPTRSTIYRYTSSRYDVGSSRDVPRNQADEFRLRIPDRSIRYTLGSQIVIAQMQKFIHPEAEQTPFDPNDSTLPNSRWHISPILPGSYGVIGSAGTQYTGNNPDLSPDAFTTVVSRWKGDTESNNQSGAQFRPNLARRIELHVNRTQLGQLVNRDPMLHQVSVMKNGGRPVGRDNELLDGAESIAASGPGGNHYGPAVAIPVEGMNISEPPWEYQAREFEMSQKDSPVVGAGSAALRFNPRLAKGEGMFGTGPNAGSPESYDTPFDDAPELERTGTTFNYRMVHLQRLANPLLPWNPAPGEFTDNNGNELYHNPSLPVNPYRTVDSSSADLTAFNGISSREADQPDDAQTAKNQFRPWVRDVAEVTAYVTRNRQWCLFRSHERGATAALATLKAQPAGTDSLPVRAIWQQEPAKDRYHVDYFRDLLPWGGNPPDQLTQLRMDGRWTLRGRDTRPEGQDGEAMHVDMVLEHSLGFGNEAMGKVYTHPSVPNNPAPTPNATGAPAANTADATMLETDATYPWLAWNNRPYSSAMELLQIPAGSSSEVLRNYSVTNPNSTADPYNGGQPTVNPTPEEINDSRDANRRGHFGHLFNFFQSSPLPADLARDNTGQPILDGTGQDAQYVPLGAPNYYRLLDYVHVPSKFVGTDTLLNPRVFNLTGDPTAIPPLPSVTTPLDPRQSLLAPFNRVSHYREPGRVNLNTVFDARVWDGGVLHRQLANFALPYHPNTNPYSNVAVHLGIPYLGFAFAAINPGDPATYQPGLVDVRRGYGDTPTNLVGLSAYLLHQDFPTIFGNPFRAGDAGDLVPLLSMLHAQGNVHGTLLRGYTVPEPPGTPPLSGGGAAPGTSEVAFADQTLRADHPSFDVQRNPYLKYAALHRAGSAGTTRSNVFAVWVTVGFFEVEPVSDTIRERYDLTNAAQRELFTRIYPQGYMLAQEIGSETGDTKRHRAFYIIDRTLPVGFKPGEDINVENIIKLRRRIE